MTVVLATFDGDTSEVFGPFNDSVAALEWVYNIEMYFISRAAMWRIMRLSAPISSADLQISGSEGS